MEKPAESLVLSTSESSHCEPVKNTLAVMESPGLTPVKATEADGNIS